MEVNETIDAAAARELKEEACISASQLHKMGELLFTFEGLEEQALEVHVFYADDFEGEPRETEEMKPMWYDVPPPYEQMWPDDAHW